MNKKHIFIISIVLLFSVAMIIGNVSAYTCTQKVDSKTHTKTLGCDSLVVKNHKIYLKNKAINKHAFNYKIDKIVCYYKNGNKHTYQYKYNRWGITLNKNIVKVKIYYSKLNNTERKNLEKNKVIPQKISMKAKPSCGCRYSYKWRTKTFFNYCPNCHKINSLKKNPKHVFEKEYTCKYCDSDFCGMCGKEKYSWSHKYLIK